MWPYQQVPESAYPEYNNYGELPEDPYISRDYLDQEYNGENVQVMDEDWDDEPYMDLEDSWIPYSPPEPQKSSPSTNVQQVVIGVPSTPHIQFPQASDLNTYFCQLHPQECRGREGGLPARNMTCTTNCTVGEDDTGGSTLPKRVNVSGFGVALLVALLIFLGLHVGWDREQSETTGKKGKGHSKSKDPEKTPGE